MRVILLIENNDTALKTITPVLIAIKKISPKIRVYMATKEEGESWLMSAIIALEGIKRRF